MEVAPANHVAVYSTRGNYRTAEIEKTVTGRSGTVHTVRLANGSMASVHNGWVCTRGTHPIRLDQDLRDANRRSYAKLSQAEQGVRVWVHLADGRVLEGRTLAPSPIHGVLGLETADGTFHRFLDALVQWDVAVG